MKQIFISLLLFALAVGCSDITEPVDAGLSLEASTEATTLPAKKGGTSVERPFKLSRSALSLDWGVERDAEVGCQLALGLVTDPDDAVHMAGGAISGIGNFTHLGRSTIEMSAAWDIGQANPNPDDAMFSPVGPAGGPFAPVLGPDGYPYDFHVNPFVFPPTCGQLVTATGDLTLTSASGHQVFGAVVGGETHRLDFIQEGDGIETFAIVEIEGGTGRFADASGSFVIHTISRFDFDALEFVIDLAEVLPGGTIAY
jgi:hypothetical protein